VTGGNENPSPCGRQKPCKATYEELRHGIEIDNPLKQIHRNRVHPYDTEEERPAAAHLYVDNPVEHGKERKRIRARDKNERRSPQLLVYRHPV